VAVRNCMLLTGLRWLHAAVVVPVKPSVPISQSVPGLLLIHFIFDASDLIIVLI
jgi:hypothetical protein